ncbi:MAG: NAD(P)H-hydrate dehydratase [Nitrospirales bacterium]|nr:NAD(P)H-hydrate dehydratase [Nitrospirales bacterium]
MKIVTAAQMQALDLRTITEAHITGLTLMEHAGTGVITAMEHAYGPLANKRVTILCGKGNNGGDGFVVARLLRRKRARPSVLLLAHAKDLQGDAARMYRRFVPAAGFASVHANPNTDRVRSQLQSADLAVDAMFGTGLSSPVSGPYKTAIDLLNDISAEQQYPVVAVDLPSGIHADTGAVLGTAVRASLTVTFGLPKMGLYLGDGIDHAGQVRIVDIGIPPSYTGSVESRVSLITSERVRQLIPRRLPSAHKGTYGHAGIIAGSIGKSGAAAMATTAALRIGTGLVTVATPASVNPVLEAKLLEAMTVPMPETEAKTLASSGLEQLVSFANARSAVAIGPGLTTHPDTTRLIQALLRRLEKPFVLDADGLNAVSENTALLNACKCCPILTPHPGEMARLDKTSAQSVNADRIGAATRFAEQHGVILVLKGARTIVARPDGHVTICPTGNPGMATAGTGDALTGIIVGLLAQQLSPWDAACAGTYLHGLAGDLAAGELGQAGMLAGDLIARIPFAMKQTTHA